MLLRAEALSAVGGLDESFFFYGEDIALCHQMRAAGWRVFFDPSGKITHLGGASSDASRLQEGRKLKLLWKARLLVQKKCYGSLSALWMRCVYATSVCLNLLSLRATGRQGTASWERTAKDLQILLNPLKE